MTALNTDLSFNGSPGDFKFFSQFIEKAVHILMSGNTDDIERLSSNPIQGWVFKLMLPGFGTMTPAPNYMPWGTQERGDGTFNVFFTLWFDGKESDKK